MLSPVPIYTVVLYRSNGAGLLFRVRLKGYAQYVFDPMDVDTTVTCIDVGNELAAIAPLINLELLPKLSAVPV